MRLYLAGPMRGYKDFNSQAFKRAAAILRMQGHVIFSPAEKDEEKHGEDILRSITGDEREASAKGFSLRDALYDDLTYICREADGIALLPGWEQSSGALAEWATAKALGLHFIYLDESYLA
jgi:Domain of unknown function (DUF4406)